MPIKGKLPELEKMGNRSKIYMALLESSLSFTELLEKTQLSRGTVAKHIRDMEQEKVIRRTRRNGKRVYKTIWDKEKLVAELKTFHFDMITQLLSHFIPNAKKEIENYLMSLAKEIVQYQIDVFEYGEAEALTRLEKRHKQTSKQKETKPLEPLKVLRNNEEGK